MLLYLIQKTVLYKNERKNTFSDIFKCTKNERKIAIVINYARKKKKDFVI